MKQIVFLYITGLAFLVISCSKQQEEMITPLTAHNVELKPLPLIQIKGYLSGNWKLHYSIGGFTGIQRRDYANATINFINGNYIDWQVDNTSVVQAPISWLRTNDIMGVSTYLLQFKSASGVPMTIGADKILNDTLILYTNSSDGFSFYLTR